MSSRNDQHNQVLDLQRQINHLRREVERASLREQWTLLDMWDRLAVHHAIGFPPTDHFRGSAVDGTFWTWEGTPFLGTPGTLNVQDSRLKFGGSASGTFFLSSTTISTTSYFAMLSMNANNDGNEIGIRLDDGSDNNYKEVNLKIIKTGDNNQLEITVRSATGGTPATPNTSGDVHIGGSVVLQFNVSGTAWSSWQAQALIVGPFGVSGGLWKEVDPGGAVSWTPTRAGIVARYGSGAATWNRFNVDWYEAS